MKVKIDTRVEPELAEKIKKEGQINGRNFCAQIRFMLEQYFKLTKNEKTN